MFSTHNNMKTLTTILILHTTLTAQDCLHTTPHLTCTNTTLDHITRDLHANTPATITITESNLGTLPTAIFQQPQTTTLELHSDNITKILPGTFTGLTGLRYLSVRKNNFAKIPIGVFNSLTKLVSLNLEENNIEYIEKQSFVGLYGLQMLSLRGNKIGFIVDGLFLGLFGLETLDLSVNFLEEFKSKEIVGNSRNLTSLLLSDNYLTYIPDLKFFEKLRDLYLNRNKITKLTNELLPKSIEKIYLSSNFISEINLNGFKSLLLLDLSNNQLTTIQPGIFSFLKNLQTLDLSTNKIKITFGLFYGLNNLQRLNLSNNNLQQLHPLSFQQLKSLEFLDLSQNNLNTQQINELLTFKYSYLQININNNNFDCYGLNKIFENFPKSLSIIYNNSLDPININNIPCRYEPEAKSEREIVWRDEILRKFDEQKYFPKVIVVFVCLILVIFFVVVALVGFGLFVVWRKIGRGDVVVKFVKNNCEEKVYVNCD